MLTNEAVVPIQSSQPPSDHELIYHEQVKLAYTQFHVCSLSSISGLIIIPLLLWNHVPHFNLFLWLGLTVFGLLIPPHILIYKYKKADEETRKKKYWGQWLVGIALLGSTAWGTQGVLLYTPESTVHLFVVLVFLSSGAAISTIVATPYPALFWTKTLPILAPFSIYALFQDDLIQIVLGTGMLFFYGGTLAVMYSNLHRNVLDSLKLRLENTHLVKQLQIKNQIAEKASDDKSRFLAAASHDLRQPLHAQALLLHELKDQLPEADNIQALIKLEASMNAMNGLFNELLDISKLDAGVVTPRYTHVSVADMFAELKTDFAVLAKEKSLQLRVRSCDCYVHSDYQLLSRILRNLISNAIKYTSSGGVLLSCRKQNSRLLFQVWDTGPGIPSEQRQLIFDEFYQLHNPERDRNKGLGLGLAIAHRLSTLLQHPLRVHSRVDQGSVFTICCPIAPNVLNIRTQPPVRSNEDLSLIKILLVEDDELILSSTRELLLKWQCKLFAAGSLQGAINHVGNLTGNGPKLIIADYRLRNNTTGMQVVDKLERILKTRVPTIIVTGDTSPEILKEIHASKRYLLHKPVAPDTLRAFINEVLHLERESLLETEAG
ncbi:MAG: hybrid sensor histidine kinase/response regulator [Gammaproteobacteria bacterium]|nr:hybrid sensor histidine kinase/response regulator [Gammaproteobacteria bacterium]MDH5799473.1 hybrid sensor histidine kinase/response regulator [Gammaproteobacteria bacterium]